MQNCADRTSVAWSCMQSKGQTSISPNALTERLRHWTPCPESMPLWLGQWTGLMACREHGSMLSCRQTVMAAGQATGATEAALAFCSIACELQQSCQAHCVHACPITDLRQGPSHPLCPYRLEQCFACRCERMQWRCWRAGKMRRCSATCSSWSRCAAHPVADAITRNPPVWAVQFLQACQEWDAIHSAELAGS